MSSGNPRRPRVAQAIREVLGKLIADELSDPRLTRAGFISINHVELNKDMSVAHVYVAFYGGDDSAAEPAIAILNRAQAGRLRGPLGRELSLQRTPELRFSYDQSGEFGMRLSEIIRDDELRRPPDETPDATRADDADQSAGEEDEND